MMNAESYNLSGSAIAFFITFAYMFVRLFRTCLLHTLLSLAFV
jgi:hypothetical protein